MNLSKKEKEKIFWALINEYPNHERSRKQAHSFFSRRPDKLSEIVDNIDEQEEKSYKLIKKFSNEVGIDIPDRVVKK